MHFCKIDSYDNMLKIELSRLEGLIRDYIIHLKTDKKLAPGSTSAYLSPISHFYEMNDIDLRWKKLKKFKAKFRSVVEDKPYTREQIKILIDSALSPRQMYHSTNGFSRLTKRCVTISENSGSSKNSEV